MKIVERILIFVAFLLLGVAISLSVGGCGPIDERPIKTGKEIRIVTLDRSYQVEDECRKLVNMAPGWKALACSQFNESLCTIRMKPDASDEILGHEARHCFDGQWHK